MKKELLFASNNPHKLKEVRSIAGAGISIFSLREAGIETDIPETGMTLEDNSREKARFIYRLSGKSCFADDTGLEIEALEGKPGIFSARYAGEECSFDDNIEKVLRELEGKENRRSLFRCVVCLIDNGKEYIFSGAIRGEILRERRGKEGFGYDPVFLPDGYSQTFAEMPYHLKNGISHRGIAMSKMFRCIDKSKTR